MIGAVRGRHLSTIHGVELQYIVRHSGRAGRRHGDQEQTDKVLDALANNDGLAGARAVVCIDMKGLRQYRQSQLMSFVGSFASSAKLCPRKPRCQCGLDRLISQRSPVDVSISSIRRARQARPRARC